MKISKYTFTFCSENGKKYAYNSLSNSLMEIDKQTYETIVCNLEKPLCDVSKLDDEIYDVLFENGIITENDEDDFLKYKSIIHAQRECKEFMHLTIAPTMDCCFKCYYCFEDHKTRSYITNEIVDNIISYINQQQDVKRLKITWFGGEPLMASDKIELFYQQFKPFTERYQFLDSNIITTGYHIDNAVIQMFKNVGISSVQITLDGMKETHNKVKHLNGEDVFSKVWTNIKLLKEAAPEIEVVIRVNLTKRNAEEYQELLKLFISDFYNLQKISISPAFVLNRNNSEICRHSNLFSHKERSEFFLKLASEGINSPFLNYPEPFFNECAIRNKVAISFDPEGYAYKCWEVIGNKKYSIGHLDNSGHIIEINEKILNRQLFGAESIEDPLCSKCKYLPIYKTETVLYPSVMSLNFSRKVVYGPVHGYGVRTAAVGTSPFRIPDCGIDRNLSADLFPFGINTYLA